MNQLKALAVLADSKDGIVEATESSDNLKLEGKALGGVFSSLARQVIDGQYLIEAWGRSQGGRGLRWKLNEKAISKKGLKETVEEVLR
ncbi:MAG: hypothetical protein WC686_02000 [Candidatus Shapirobacteria bacterium]